jgi:hypothetical protein
MTIQMLQVANTKSFTSSEPGQSYSLTRPQGYKTVSLSSVLNLLIVIGQCIFFVSFRPIKYLRS